MEVSTGALLNSSQEYTNEIYEIVKDMVNAVQNKM
jgi:hypothetical protein